jgi:branched-chain amino acid transport system permease protein
MIGGAERSSNKPVPIGRRRISEGSKIGRYRVEVDMERPALGAPTVSERSVTGRSPISREMSARSSALADPPRTTLTIAESQIAPAASRPPAALDFVGLADRAGALAASLPYGHQRMVEIARALAGNPALLLLDEPAAGLNLTEKQALGQLLGRLRGLGMTLLLIEHDMDLVEQVADRITVLNFGKRIADGTPAEVLRHPEVVAAYLGEEAGHEFA